LCCNGACSKKRKIEAKFCIPDFDVEFNCAGIG
jgi:hypothetical protein